MAASPAKSRPHAINVKTTTLSMPMEHATSVPSTTAPTVHPMEFAALAA